MHVDIHDSLCSDNMQGGEVEQMNIDSEITNSSTTTETIIHYKQTRYRKHLTYHITRPVMEKASRQTGRNHR